MSDVSFAVISSHFQPLAPLCEIQKFQSLILLELERESECRNINVPTAIQL